MRELAREILEHALAECSISKAFSRHLLYDRSRLTIGDEVYDLGSFTRTLVVAMGKAAHAMTQMLATITEGSLSGVVACPVLPSEPVLGFRYFQGGHPLPNAASLRAADAILDLLSTPSEHTLVIYCISGGASAIAEKPIRDEISLADVVQTYRALVHSGAPIAEINTIRKHLSALKGGRLAAAASPAHQASIFVSDVPESSLDALASGPTIPDSTTVSDCHAIADRYNLLSQFPDSVGRLFARGLLQETPKAGDRIFARSHYATLLSNAVAQREAVACAILGGFAVEIDSICDDWEYSQAADHLLGKLRELRRGVSRLCLISGGEVTVKVSGKPGVGGRNQQFALYCARKIAGENITVLSAGTDGIDGNSPAAGAVVDGTTVMRAHARGLDPTLALAQFDAFPLLAALGDTIVTGPTGNNLRDLRILLAY
jgi:hydroxypyruvate reductase